MGRSVRSSLAAAEPAAAAAETAVPVPDRFQDPEVCDPHTLGAGGKIVAILCNEGCDVHRVELAVPAILEENVIVGWHVKMKGLWDACALVLEVDDLGNGLVAPSMGCTPAAFI